jgi:hypothetical protein
MVRRHLTQNSRIWIAKESRFRLEFDILILFIFSNMLEQSFCDILNNKFCNDLQEIAKSLCELHSLHYDARVEPPIRRWISYVARLVEPKERLVYFSKDFCTRVPKQYVSAVHLLADKFEYGENVNPYLSTSLLYNNFAKKKGGRTDLLWADWKIHHFHLTTSFSKYKKFFSERSDYLLFAYVGDDYVCFLDVKYHKSENVFSNPIFVKQLVESWPELAEVHAINGIHVENCWNAEEIKKLRKGGLTPLTSVKGRAYMMGLGVSTAGTAGDDVFLYDSLVDEIKYLSQDILIFLNRRNALLDPMTFSLKLKNDGLSLENSIDESFGKASLCHLEQVNRFFNQPWLLKKN